MIRSGFRVALICAASLSSACALGQGFNIDLDIDGPEGIGGGPPSSDFSAAAGQSGFWNRFSGGAGPYHVRDLDDQPTEITMTVDSKFNLFSGGGFLFKGNTGDYARLLNDGADVGSVVQGGGKTYTFNGLAFGTYQVYTYAVNPLGPVDVPVFVPEAIKSQTQVVTGPMPGNSFEYLVTHSVHLVDCSTTGSLRINIVQPPGTYPNMFVNGFQIVAVPEPSPAFVIFPSLALLMLQRNHRQKQRGENLK